MPRLLLAVTGRDPSPRVGEAVRQLTKRLGLALTVVHVVMRPTSVAGNELDGSPANDEETAVLRELRSATVGWLGDSGADVPIKILHGDPGQRICEYADYLDAAWIVLGPREKESMAKRFRGSVSKYVLANTRRSVLVLGN